MKPALILFWRAMLARAYPRVILFGRMPTVLVQESVLPVLSVAAFAFVYRAMEAPEEYTGFVILGGAMSAFWLNVLWSMAAQLYWDRDEGNLELYIMAPASLMAILAGMAVGGLIMTLVRATVIVAAGLVLFGVSFAPASWWAVAGVFLLTMLALYGLGMLLASAFLMWGREAWHIVNLLQEPVYLLSGLNFPVKTLGPAAMVAALLPLTTGIDALRQLLFPATVDQGFLPVWVEIVLLAVLAMIFLVLAQVSLARLERRARQEGRLTVKWQ
jgi:ABC-2 type transport system permease protein